MYRMSIYYPQGGDFDMDYYLSKHMPFVAECAGDTLVRWEVDKGLSGMAPGTPPPNVAVAYLYFESPDEFAKAFTARVGEIIADTPNYTPIRPQIQVSEIVKG